MRDVASVFVTLNASTFEISALDSSFVSTRSMGDGSAAAVVWDWGWRSAVGSLKRTVGVSGRRTAPMGKPVPSCASGSRQGCSIRRDQSWIRWSCTISC